MKNLRVLKPLTIPDLFDEVFSFYRKNFLLIFGIAGLVYVPYYIIFKLIYSIPPGTLTEGPAWSTLGASLWTSIFFLLAAMLAEAALIKAVADRYLGQPSSVLGAYGFILQRFSSVIGTLFLLVLAWIGGIITIIGWIFVFFWTVFVMSVFAIEDRAFTDAFSRSRELAQKNWGRIFLVGVITILISVIINGGIEWLIELIFGKYPQGVQAVIAGSLTGLAEAMVVPLGLTAFVSLYFDIRVRKEGFDLQILAQEMAMRTGAEAPPTAPPAPPSV